MKKYCNFTNWETQIEEMNREATSKQFQDWQKKKKQVDKDKQKKKEDIESTKSSVKKKEEEEINRADEYVIGNQ